LFSSLWIFSRDGSGLSCGHRQCGGWGVLDLAAQRKQVSGRCWNKSSQRTQDSFPTALRLAARKSAAESSRFLV